MPCKESCKDFISGHCIGTGKASFIWVKNGIIIKYKFWEYILLFIELILYPLCCIIKFSISLGHSLQHINTLQPGFPVNCESAHVIPLLKTLLLLVSFRVKAKVFTVAYRTLSDLVSCHFPDSSPSSLSLIVHTSCFAVSPTFQTHLGAFTLVVSSTRTTFP